MEQLLHDGSIILVSIILGILIGMIIGFFIGRKHGGKYDKVKVIKAKYEKMAKEEIGRLNN